MVIVNLIGYDVVVRIKQIAASFLVSTAIIASLFCVHQLATIFL